MKTIQNPILRGFCPDPCMIRTGDDYYIATSTFEWWPCGNLYHSKDLAHWEQLPSPLREPGQMDLRGDPNSGGIWAPDLSWDGQYYYLLVTNVTTKKGRWYNTHNYMSRAASITGPWSQPVYLNSIGFDPSLLHDTDGKCYLVNMVNGFKGVLVQQMDPETGAVVPRGQRGEFCTKGYSVMHGYWEDPAKTHEAIDADGWMHTGDLATMDAEGYVNIVGRIKDMVIRGGENIYPREIEEFLYRHPQVQDVQVVGVPDQKYGEELCAWIIAKPGTKPTEDDIRAFCKGQIAHYKVPRYIRFVTSFPMTVTGKIQKFKIRDEMKDLLGLEEQKTA